MRCQWHEDHGDATHYIQIEHDAPTAICEHCADQAETWIRKSVRYTLERWSAERWARVNASLDGAEEE